MRKAIISGVIVTLLEFGCFASARALSIKVMNGCGITGAETRMAEFLKAKGFEIAAVGAAKKSDYKQTVIFYKKEVKEAADAVIKIESEIPNAQKMEPITWKAENDIIIVVGTPESDLKVPPPPPPVSGKAKEQKKEVKKEKEAKSEAKKEIKTEKEKPQVKAAPAEEKKEKAEIKSTGKKAASSMVGLLFSVILVVILLASGS